MSQAACSSLIGCELGHYRILSNIGAGGMGEVFLAHDQHLGHNVALKVLGSGNDEFRRHLFRREARALSKLNHPNIVTVLDFDTQGGVDFLVMEYVPGRALDERIRDGALPEDEVIAIGVQLAEGLSAAHAHGVIHRDLKPSNLRLTYDNRLKILDFGLARSILNFSPLASTVNFAGPADCSGTIPYMAPEQLMGGEIDQRTDIYATGAVLYELYVGGPPFQQQVFTALVGEILHKVPTAPERIRPEISKGLQSIILRCLEKDPARRYQSAAELGRELRNLKSQNVRTGNRIGIAIRRRMRLYATASLGIVLLALVIVPSREHAPNAIRRNEPTIESLAVLPFANLSGDAQQEYLADGITDFLITDLGQMQALQRIISRTSVVRYKTERQTIGDIARQLNVQAVVEGSVRRAEKKVIVSVRLVSADDRQFWAHSYETDIGDLLTLQHELALGIVGEIRSGSATGNRADTGTRRFINPSAQEAYLRAKYLQFGTAEQRARSRQYLQEAVTLDSNYAAAFAALADSYWNDISLPTSESMPTAREYALKAIALDENLAHAHTSLATVRFYGDWDWVAADEEYQRALQLNPIDAEAHRMYSVFLAAMGRSEEALAHVLKSQELDPLYNGNNTTAGWVLYCAHRYDQALDNCKKAMEWAPNEEITHACLSYSYLGKGETELAIGEAQKAWTLSGEQPVWAVLLSRTYAQSGNRTRARQILRDLVKQSKVKYVPPTFMTAMYAALGDKETAIHWLSRAYEQRDLYLAVLKVDPAFDPLRSDARFVQLMERMGLAH